LFIVFAAVFLLAASSEDCDYIEGSTGYMTDGSKIRNCFNSYNVSMDFVNAIIRQVELTQKVYPYVDIAKNPPENMRNFFDPVDFAEELEYLKANLTESEGNTSKVFRPVARFFGKFYDGHFHMSFNNTDSAKNLFADIAYQFPFEWKPILSGSKTKVKLSPNSVSAVLGNDFQNTLLEKEDVFVSTIDGKDAFEYLKEFHKETSTMKSLQGILFLARAKGISTTQMLSQPLDDEDFDPHTIVFEDGSDLSFSLIFSKEEKQTFSHSARVIRDVEKNLLERISAKRIREDNCQRTWVDCLATPMVDVMHVGTFLPNVPQDELLHEANCMFQQLAECAQSFDDNEAPILISVLGNGGGLEVLSRAMSYFFFPQYDHTLVKAFRNTDESKGFSKYVITSQENNIFTFDSNTCQPITDASFDAFLQETVVDDLGNGVKHNRTNKFFQVYPLVLPQYTISKHPRKPTDVVVVTDGVCASVCSMFMKSVLENGAAIVAGVGTPYDGNEKFTASQIAANNIMQLTDIFPEVAEDSEKYGIQTGVTIIEHYPISPALDEVIPREFVLDKIDVNLGDNFSFPYSDDEELEKIALQALLAQKAYTSTCNPDNKRLFMVNDKCQSEDPNVLQMGYACGSDGHWDENDCRVLLCNAGFMVDFKTNSCVTDFCALSSSQSSTSSSSSSPSTTSPSVSSSSHLLVNSLAFAAALISLLI